MDDDACSEALNGEAFDLMMNLMTLRELQDKFVESGATLEFLRSLQKSVIECELGNNPKILQGQFTQVI